MQLVRSNSGILRSHIFNSNLKKSNENKFFILFKKWVFFWKIRSSTIYELAFASVVHGPLALIILDYSWLFLIYSAELNFELFNRRFMESLYFNSESKVNFDYSGPDAISTRPFTGGTISDWKLFHRNVFLVPFCGPLNQGPWSWPLWNVLSLILSFTDYSK